MPHRMLNKGDKKNLQEQSAGEEGKSGHGGHGHWMMIACCIPMLVIVAILVATGAVSFGFILAAVGCVAMMGLMMFAMSRGS